MRTQIRNVTLLTINPRNEIFYNSSITFENDWIIAINEDVGADIIIDGQQALCMPGMVNTHAHLSMIPFRSLQDDLPDRLRKFLLPLEQLTMTPELAAAACKVGIAESLLSGVTTVLDFYYYPDVLAECYKTMNMRAVVAETILREPSCDTAFSHGGLNIAEDFIKNWKDDSLVTPAIGPHGTTTVDEAILIKASEISRKYSVPMTVHVSEMEYEMTYFREKYDMTPIEYLESIGILDERFIVGHGIHTQGKDFDILKKHGCSVAHCIGSNTKAAKGIAPVKTLLEHGIPVGLGSDGPSSGNTLDLFIQMNLFAKFHKVSNHNRTLFPAHEIVRLATFGGAKVLGMDTSIGSLEVGKKADIVLVETQSINMFPIFDPLSALVYSANPSNVQHVWVNGVQVVKDKQLVNFNVQTLKTECTKQMSFFIDEAKRISSTL